jgi:hypothetical protein
MKNQFEWIFQMTKRVYQLGDITQQMSVAKYETFIVYCGAIANVNKSLFEF